MRESIRLVAITDNLRDGIVGLADRVRAAVAGGVTMIHVRLPDESPRALAEATRALVDVVAVPVLVHGRADVALATGAAGVHLGVHDPPPSAVRRLLGALAIVGASAADASECEHAADADYIAVGPVFPARPERNGDLVLGTPGLERLAAHASCPVLAIGGITSERAPLAFRAGASGVALISAILGARDPGAAARAIRSAIES